MKVCAIGLGKWLVCALCKFPQEHSGAMCKVVKNKTFSKNGRQSNKHRSISEAKPESQSSRNIKELNIWWKGISNFVTSGRRMLYKAGDSEILVAGIAEFEMNKGFKLKFSYYW